MTKIAFIGDLHIADRPPLGRVEGYKEQILNKLKTIAGICNEHDA
ncbi:hypothetical protein LCGC14_1418710, partial [marine sediment metagenome]